MRAILASVLLFLISVAAVAEDLVLVNGTVIDGTGKPRSLANIRIREDKISDIGLFKPAPNEMTIDVTGMIVAPGFIDFQTLSPAAIEKDPTAGSLISQGVTTAVLGADGSGSYSVEDFMRPFDEKPPSLNIAILAGHATIRRQILGADYKRQPTADELQRMGELVSDAMKQGAFGLASDLQQEPASFSSQEELLALARVVAKFGGTILLRARDPKQAATIVRDAKVAVVDISVDAYSYAQFVQDKGVVLERAIGRMSSTPAARFSLRERGVLKKGAPADIVVFNPNSLSSGLKYVFVNGAMALKSGEVTTAHAGQALR